MTNDELEEIVKSAYIDLMGAQESEIEKVHAQIRDMMKKQTVEDDLKYFQQVLKAMRA